MSFQKSVTSTTWCQKAASAIRCIKTKPQGELFSLAGYGQKAPSAIRCIKTIQASLCSDQGRPCQKAPSAIRCIKTQQRQSWAGYAFVPVRKHRAPPNLACISLSSNFNERRKPRHLNSATSSLEGVEAELHATFSNNPALLAP